MDSYVGIGAMKLKKAMDSSVGIGAAIFEACGSGNLAKLKEIKDTVGDVMQYGLICEKYLDSTSGQTVLNQAAGMGHLNVCKFLIDDIGVNIEVETNMGDTPVIAASKGNHVEVATYLVSKKALLQVANCQGFTSLHYAVLNGNLELMELFMNNGAPIESDSNDGTPLHCAASRGNVEAVKVLLARGAKLDSMNLFRDTPLLCAVRARSFECVDLLLKSEAVPNMFLSGLTPVAQAAQYGDKKIVKRLIEAKANPSLSSADDYFLVAVKPALAKTMARDLEDALDCTFINGLTIGKWKMTSTEACALKVYLNVQDRTLNWIICCTGTWGTSDNSCNSSETRTHRLEVRFDDITSFNTIYLPNYTTSLGVEVESAPLFYELRGLQWDRVPDCTGGEALINRRIYSNFSMESCTIFYNMLRSQAFLQKISKKVFPAYASPWFEDSGDVKTYVTKAPDLKFEDASLVHALRMTQRYRLEEQHVNEVEDNLQFEFLEFVRDAEESDTDKDGEDETQLKRDMLYAVHRYFKHGKVDLFDDKVLRGNTDLHPYLVSLFLLLPLSRSTGDYEHEMSSTMLRHLHTVDLNQDVVEAGFHLALQKIGNDASGAATMGRFVALAVKDDVLHYSFVRDTKALFPNSDALKAASWFLTDPLCKNLFKERWKLDVIPPFLMET